MLNSQLETDLRRAARDRINREQLPRTAPASMWGGKGSGRPCALCDRPISPDDWELQLEEKRHGEGTQAFHFHVACESLWRRECSVAGDGDGAT
jgi:hypothetical protein